MKFIIQKWDKDLDFSLVYDEESYSFDSKPHHGDGFTSIMINELQLEIDDLGKILYVWGYCPLIKHQETGNFPHGYKKASLVALFDEPLIPGVSYRLNEGHRWAIHINKEKKWVCIGNPDHQNRKLVEFYPDCVATMEGDKILAIWLHPKKLPDCY